MRATIEFLFGASFALLMLYGLLVLSVYSMERFGPEPIDRCSCEGRENCYERDFEDNRGNAVRCAHWGTRLGCCRIDVERA